MITEWTLGSRLLLSTTAFPEDDVYEMHVKVTYRPLPPVPEVVYERQEPLSQGEERNKLP
jgi:hypothetical protein